jgi:hypothetical protein
LAGGKNNETGREYSSAEQRKYGQVFAVALSWFITILFIVVAFKLIRQYLDFGRPSLILLIGAVIVLVSCSACCFAYGLLNLVPPIGWQHVSNIL